jgi:hypothetical protein
MARPEVSATLEVRIEGSQLEFLESKAKELGISKQELAKLYIEKAINAEREEDHFSLEGRFKDGPPIPEEIIDEVIAEWDKTE